MSHALTLMSAEIDRLESELAYMTRMANACQETAADRAERIRELRAEVKRLAAENMSLRTRVGAEGDLLDAWDAHSHAICDALGDHYSDDGTGFDYDKMVSAVCELAAAPAPVEKALNHRDGRSHMANEVADAVVDRLREHPPVQGDETLSRLVRAAIAYHTCRCSGYACDGVCRWSAELEEATDALSPEVRAAAEARELRALIGDKS